ncbi:MAG: hypothetical protein HEP71_33330 [Roseivirga sp.]|nr:hypothetical protein [Roseivirga sp.]
MEDPWDLIELPYFGESRNSRQRNNRSPRNSDNFRFILFFLSVLTFFGLMVEFGLNSKLLTDIGWWLALLPLSLLPTYGFIRYLYQKEHLVHLTPLLLVYIIFLFLLVTFCVIGFFFL